MLIACSNRYGLLHSRDKFIFTHKTFIFRIPFNFVSCFTVFAFFIFGLLLYSSIHLISSPHPLNHHATSYQPITVEPLITPVCPPSPAGRRHGRVSPAEGAARVRPRNTPPRSEEGMDGTRCAHTPPTPLWMTFSGKSSCLSSYC